MVVTFMTLIMTKRMSAVAALIVVPIVFGLLAGAGPSIGKMMVEGVLQVTPTALMLAFAVLYFAIVMDAGLFDPLVRRVLAPLTALASLPLTFVMSNDAYYFGLVPVIAETAANYAIAPEVIARASLIGQPVHMLSPLLAPIYLVCGLLRVDVGEAQRFALKWAILVSLVVLVAAVLTGAIPLRGLAVQ